MLSEGQGPAGGLEAERQPDPAAAAPCPAPPPRTPTRRRLIHGAFGGGAGVSAAQLQQQLPDYLTSGAFYKFTPSEELISLPGDIARTEFRLVVTLANGWEYTGGWEDGWCVDGCGCGWAVQYGMGAGREGGEMPTAAAAVGRLGEPLPR